jgi:hypothetical protein
LLPHDAWLWVGAFVLALATVDRLRANWHQHDYVTARQVFWVTVPTMTTKTSYRKVIATVHICKGCDTTKVRVNHD